MLLNLRPEANRNDLPAAAQAATIAIARRERRRRRLLDRYEFAAPYAIAAVNWFGCGAFARLRGRTRAAALGERRRA